MSERVSSPLHFQAVVRCERPRLNIAALLKYSVRRAATHSLKITDQMYLIKVPQFVSYDEP